MCSHVMVRAKGSTGEEEKAQRSRSEGEERTEKRRRGEERGKERRGKEQMAAGRTRGESRVCVQGYDESLGLHTQHEKHFQCSQVELESVCI